MDDESEEGREREGLGKSGEEEKDKKERSARE